VETLQYYLRQFACLVKYESNQGRLDFRTSRSRMSPSLIQGNCLRSSCNYCYD